MRVCFCLSFSIIRSSVWFVKTKYWIWFDLSMLQHFFSSIRGHIRRRRSENEDESLANDYKSMSWLAFRSEEEKNMKNYVRNEQNRIAYGRCDCVNQIVCVCLYIGLCRCACVWMSEWLCLSVNVMTVQMRWRSLQIVRFFVLYFYRNGMNLCDWWSKRRIQNAQFSYLFAIFSVTWFGYFDFVLEF